jgi:hypothetical protein
MFGQIYFRVLGIGCFLSMALLSSAQSKLDSLHHLNEVVVTARINKEVIPVQSLSGDKLEKLAAHSVADAIRYFSRNISIPFSRLSVSSERTIIHSALPSGDSSRYSPIYR